MWLWDRIPPALPFIGSSFMIILVDFNIDICSMELKWDGKITKYDKIMITRWGEYD